MEDQRLGSKHPKGISGLKCQPGPEWPLHDVLPSLDGCWFLLVSKLEMALGIYSWSVLFFFPPLSILKMSMIRQFHKWLWKLSHPTAMVLVHGLFIPPLLPPSSLSTTNSTHSPLSPAQICPFLAHLFQTWRQKHLSKTALDMQRAAGTLGNRGQGTNIVFHKPISKPFF